MVKKVINTINIKPLSVNQAWQGKRFKTKKYAKYERDVLLMLPKLSKLEPPFEVALEFGFSNVASDIDNPIKPILDIIQKKYGINDKDIYELKIKKTVVPKKSDYIKFSINTKT
jgi:Holliday junction resolvase RusA-like endonuclease